MSDIDQTEDVVSDTTVPALIEAAPPAEPGKAAEPTLELAASSPPSEPRVQTLESVTHSRYGGSAGVRVQQLGGVLIQRGGGGDPLDATSMRVSRDVFVELDKLLAADDSQLGQAVYELFRSQLSAAEG